MMATTKATLVFVLIVVSVSACQAAEKHVLVTIRTAAAIAETDDNFICATLDWWPPNKCNYGQCPWGHAGLEKLDLHKRIFHNAVKGNELCGEGVSGRISAPQYAKDMRALKKLVKQLYPDPATQPKVLGPAGFYDKKWFEEFLRASGPGVVDGLTHHIYNLGPGVDKEIIHKIQDPFFLNQVAQTYHDIETSIKKFGPWAPAWVGEAGGAYNSGGKGVQNTFVDGYWYLDQLGMTSSYNHKVFCRQALVGGNYALLNTTTFIPNPDYYGALLWHRLMGKTVLATTQYVSPYLRAYSHCSRTKPGVATKRKAAEAYEAQENT
ncbi:hypothetical protein Droror1_Dr00018829 [Drosera rotundifolia]